MSRDDQTKADNLAKIREGLTELLTTIGGAQPSMATYYLDLAAAEVEDLTRQMDVRSNREG